MDLDKVLILGLNEHYFSYLIIFYSLYLRIFYLFVIYFSFTDVKMFYFPNFATILELVELIEVLGLELDSYFLLH